MRPLKKLITRRGGYRDEIQRLYETIDEILTCEVINCSNLRKFKCELAKQAEKLEALNDDVQEAIDVELLSDEIRQCTEISMSIDEVLFKADEALNRTKEETDEKQFHAKNVRLSIIELPKFDGSFLNWQTFWDLYDSTVHQRADLGNASKFHYLTSQLTGEAAKLLRGFNSTDSEYLEAIELLKKTYGKTAYVVNAHLCAILDLEPPGPTGQELSTFRSSYEGHLRAMKSLNADIDSAGFVFATILLRKLPPVIQDHLNRESQRDNWDLESLRTAIEIEINHLKASDPASNLNDQMHVHGAHSEAYESYNKATILSTNVRTVKACYLCKSPLHIVFNCDKYASTEDRRDQIKKLKLCFNCLREGHGSRQCVSSANCRKCNGRHHTILCNSSEQHGRQRFLTARVPNNSYMNRGRNNDKRAAQHSVAVETGSTTNSIGIGDAENKYSVILPTASVKVESNNLDRKTHATALLDLGSQRSFILKNLLSSIKYEKLGSIRLTISGFCNSLNSELYDLIRINIILESEIIPIDVIVVEKLPSKISMPGRAGLVKKLLNEGFRLADLDECDIVSLSLLIGADHYGKFVYSPIRDTVTLTPSKFGTLVSGPIINRERSSDHINVENVTVLKIGIEDTVDLQLERLWKLDSLEDYGDGLSDFKHCSRFEDDHFIARLPWKNEKADLPLNYNNSFRRLNSLLKSLRKDKARLDQYDNQIKEQLANNFIEKVDLTEKDVGKVHYIPHHGIIKSSSSTTPLRIVFDCSSKAKPDLLSLNDCLYSGPVLLNEMIAILLRFRAFEYACISDIMKAFLMVELEYDDRNVTRFLWPDDPHDPDSPITVYRFRVVLFGATCSQFLLNLSIRVHLEQYRSEIIRNLEDSLYVDNVVYSTKTESDLIEFFNESCGVMNQANFKLRSWVSNSSKLNSIIPSDIRDDKAINGEKINVLGMLWDVDSDRMLFRCHYITDFENITKRSILSECSKIFDPLGILLPVTIASRILIQDIWKLKVQWDQPLTDDIRSRWISLASDLNYCQQIDIPRSVNLCDVEICCFCDASTKAYGAVLYLKCGTRINFFIAKARVAPVKPVTLPSLELLGAEVASKLVNYTIESLRKVCNVKSVNIWSDSQIALSWINSTKFSKNYVRKRVEKIKLLATNANWNFINGKNNPADYLTRGIAADSFTGNSVWFNGPDWLGDKSMWPEKTTPLLNDYEIISTNVTNTAQTEELFSRIEWFENFVKRFSNFRKTVRVFAYVIQFIDRLKKLNKSNGPHDLSPIELVESENKLINLSQKLYYSDVFSYIKCNGKNVPMPNIVSQLNLFLEDDLIKCKGRLGNSELSHSARFPILLPSNSHLCTLIVNYYHELSLHGGVNLLLANIRERFWIIKGRQRLKKFVRDCIICKRHHGRLMKSSDTSPLPRIRVSQSLPFTYTGVDYAGPLNVKIKDAVEKVYICLFTCMTTRAIHLELAEDLTVDTFIHAFRRFVARRSCPSVMFSDNAGNFKFGNNYLYDLSRVIKVKEKLNNMRVNWSFIPSRAPHFGGTWERLIGMTKLCLKKIIGTKLITERELRTLLCEIECQLNNRPLAYMTDSIDDEPLTPSHLIYGRNLNCIASQCIDSDYILDPEFSCNNLALSKRNIILNSLLDHFWSRWTEEYLKALRERDRSLLGKKCNLKIGSIVLIADSLPRSVWRLGKIISLKESRGGWSSMGQKTQKD